MQLQSDSSPPAPVGHDLAAQLAATFVATFEASAGAKVTDLAALRAAVFAFVREAKERGDPPERVIVALKEVTNGAVTWFRATARQFALREELIRWCLDEYYGERSLTGESPSVRPLEYGKPTLAK